MKRKTLSFSLQGSLKNDEETIFSNIKLKINFNKWTSIIGKSGSGKSTLLKVMAGMDLPEVFINTIKSSNKNFSFSWMAQNDLLLPWASVIDNITLGQKLRREKLDLERALNLLKQVGLINKVNALPSTLSGGMRQRVALARTIMENKNIILMDEPFSALDSITRSEMQKLTWELLKDKTVIMVTHDPLEALLLSNDLYYITKHKLNPIKLPNSEPFRKINDKSLLYSHKFIFNKLEKS
ncbi:MAG: Aliphatic sulfonates import ATP-binding protein SsuB [Alphaproteobacteria bacterium MarineAlpha9_Bin3]|nr:MAG: Aliphatic sulfonates import ATP-binding protein SsuB [Alphaproteobacteria bacterium MarineAlpha9_Bin3]|tara:strand:- start:11477 stop:12193 length:717 start_codon:yes stop_codon:yes gene_type:complete